tara:strand:+ start:12915 stop:13028 length:114 start_codon:yes stop_codon:yes gene_type:complete
MAKIKVAKINNVLGIINTILVIGIIIAIVLFIPSLLG